MRSIYFQDSIAFLISDPAGCSLSSNRIPLGAMMAESSEPLGPPTRALGGFAPFCRSCDLLSMGLDQRDLAVEIRLFSAWSLRATPQTAAIRSSIVSECPVYSASSKRAITDCVVPTFLASSV